MALYGQAGTRTSRRSLLPNESPTVALRLQTKRWHLISTKAITNHRTTICGAKLQASVRGDQEDSLGRTPERRVLLAPCGSGLQSNGGTGAGQDGTRR